MRYLLTITIEGNETINLWAMNESSGRAAGNLLSAAPGVEAVTLTDTKNGKMIADWLGTADG